MLNESGKQLRRDVVETNGQALVGYLKQLPGNLHLCIEEGEWSQWLYEILSPHVAELVVYRSEWKPGVKSDAIDAHGLAEKLRTGTVGRPVYKDAKRFTALREHARAYAMVTRDVARVKSRIKAFYRSRGVPCAGDAVYRPAERAKRAQALPPATRRAVELLGRELDALVVLKAEAECAMLRESHRHRIARILETAPGFGPVRVGLDAPDRDHALALPDEAPVLGVLRLRHRDPVLGGLDPGRRPLGEGPDDPDAGAQLQPQPHAQGAVQGRGHHGDRPQRTQPAAGGL